MNLLDSIARPGRKALTCLLSGCLLTAAVSAGIINVPGDQASIVAGVNAANSGDTVVVAAGTYTETSGVVFSKNNVTLQASGGTVILHGLSSDNSLVYINSGITSITLTGIRIERPAADSTWRRCVEAGANAGVRFNNCEFYGNANSVGVILFNSADGNFQNCIFGNFNSAATWAAAISLEGNSGTGYSDVIVEGSTFATGCVRWLAATGATVPKLGLVRFRNNTCNAASSRSAIFFMTNTPFDATQPVLFEDCVFNGTSTELMEFFYTNAGGPQSWTMRRCRINAYNSTSKIMWMDLPTSVLFENVLIAGGKHQTLLRFWGGPSSVTFRQCTFINDGASTAEGSGGVAGSSIIDGWDSGRTFSVRNCLFQSPTNYTAALVGDSGSSANRTYNIDYSIIDHATPSGAKVTLTAGSSYSNRTILFTDAGNRDYTLAAGSPGLGEGLDLGIATDVLGNTRPNPPATPPDMGAFETVIVPVELSTFAAM
jgi:hypothetical protein